METLGDAFPKELARVKETLGHYKDIGPPGYFAVAWISKLVERSEKAWADQDVVAMISCYNELKEVAD